MGRAFALSIAGFDPSAGAGILADIKTFEQCGVYGLAACSALTAQTDLEFRSVKWLSFDDIQTQLEGLFERFREIAAVKIGLIENLEVLSRVVYLVKRHWPNSPIVWDPIAEASSGFKFHADFKGAYDKGLLKSISVVTPNRLEALSFVKSESPQAAARALSRECAVILKGGHSQGESCEDILFQDGRETVFSKKRQEGASAKKHGSGCVYSAALCAALARGKALEEACASAQDYAWNFLGSNGSLLGYHSP
ncbi:MAG: hydroxymethylpyrimidine/phosphomethylpyrimidine kinase [Proteobacteria bacterium]|nr:MAG: hydroxymethylpyrimidine/phosphomethylpyrimidine kinase [Pseudomonadota bacterium]